MIEILLHVTPKCGHDDFDPKCKWCADSQRVARELVQEANRRNDETKVELMVYVDTSGYNPIGERK